MLSKLSLSKIALALLLLASPVAAQQSQSSSMSELELSAQSGPDGVYVMILTALLHPDVASQNEGWLGYNVYRKAEADSDFSKLNKEPLSRPASLIELEARLDSPLDGVEAFLGLESVDEFWELIRKDDQRVKTLELFSPALSQALGRLFIDRDVQKNLSYTYRTTRVDKKNEESAPSREVTLTYGVPTVPILGPDSVLATPGHKTAELSWLPNPADSSAIGFRVYRAITDFSALENITVEIIPLITDAPWIPASYDDTVMIQDTSFVPHAEFIDDDVLVGRTYYYAVVAVDYLGNESVSDTLYDVIISDNRAPRNPQNVFAFSDPLGVRIEWEPMITADSDDGDDDVAGYRIYRSINPDSLYALASDSLTPRNPTLWVDRIASITDEFYYRVTAIDRAGNESEKSAKAFSTHDDTHAPEAAFIDSVIGEIDAIRVHWSPVDGDRLSGYLIFRAHKYKGDLTQVSDLLPTDSLVFIDNDELLSDAGTYWYFTQSMTVGGRTGEYSVPMTGAPLKVGAPSAPGSLDGYSDAKGNSLSWKAPLGVTVWGYNVYRAQAGVSGDWQKLNAAQIQPGMRWFTDTTAAFEMLYEYTVRALDLAGEESGNSRTLELKRFSAIAGAPADLRVTNDNGALSLHWTASSMPALDGYNIYRRTVGKTPEKIANINAVNDQENYTDNSVSAGTRYYYSISIITSDGRESSRSVEVSYLLR